MERTIFVCSHCGEIHSLDEAVGMGAEVICEDCAMSDTVICDRCGTRVWNEDNSVSDGRTTLCTDCFESHYVRCYECENIIPLNSAHYDDDDEAYCDRCWDEILENRPIHEYNYKPEPVFYGDGPRCFGVELEIDYAGKEDDSARQILDVDNVINDHLYIKSDGSLDEGLELVSHPMSIDYHMNQMPWSEILSKARSLDYLSHKTNTCGLHIHISRETFGYTVLHQECAIARLLYFIEKFWPELLRFSRRTESQINRWESRYGMKLSPHEMMDAAKRSYAGRYMAVNLMNRHTVEIRIFRETLKLNTFLATLQMVNAICDVAIFMSNEELQQLLWHGFLDHIHYSELI